MIQEVVLGNFKSFRDATFPLSPLTLILGANGSGKSNFFDALRLLRYLSEGTSIRDAIEGHATLDLSTPVVPEVRGGGENIPHFLSGSTVFRLEVTARSNGGLLTYSVSINASTYRVSAESLKSTNHPGNYVFSTEDDLPAPEPDDAAIPARYYTNVPGRNPRRDFSPFNTILSQFEGRRAHSNMNEDVADTMRTELQAIRNLELRPEVLRQYSKKSVFDLGEHGENFAAIIWLLGAMASARPEAGDGPTPRGLARERLDALQAWLGELTPRGVQEVATIDSPTDEVLFAVRETPFDELINARSLSDGTLRFAAFATALLFPPVFVGAPRRTLLIEELENGINPARLQLLVRLLETTTSEDTFVQVAATTHSPGLLNWASDETLRRALVVGWNDDKKCSRVVRIGDIPRFEEVVAKTPVGDLQAEGWLEFAVDEP